MIERINGKETESRKVKSPIQGAPAGKDKAKMGSQSQAPG